MAEPESTFERVVLPVVQRYAAMHFANHPDRDGATVDAISEAWLGLQAKPDASPQAIAWYAVRRVKVGRQFAESARSITGPNPRRRQKPVREPLDVWDVFREGYNPAKIVAIRVDFREWFRNLSKRKQRIVRALAEGDTTTEVAERFGLSLGRISQIRAECSESFRHYTA
jgi:DNA-binding NarL/FixJ family response regulator